MVAKYTPGGKLVWAKSFGSNDADTAQSVITDLGGNIYVTGFFNATINFGGTNSVTSAGGDDIFVLKLDANGNTVWAKSFGGTGNDQGSDITVMSDGGAVFVAGLFENQITFETTHTSAGSTDLFLIGLSDLGTAWVGYGR